MKKRFAYLLPLLAVSVLAQRAAAVDIIVWYWHETQGVDDDAQGSRLMKIAKEAAKRWEALLPNNGQVVSIGIGYDSWADGIDSDTLAEWDPTWNNIEVNDAKIFYYDPEPENDEEYDLAQELHRDIPSAWQDAWFDGSSIPALMEVGYLGGPTATATAEVDKTDLLTVMMHEIGHSLGVNYAWSEDYDIEPYLMGWRDGGNQVKIDGQFGGHLMDPDALMGGWGLPPGLRRLPCATDLFALVDDEDYTSIRLKRVDYIKNMLSGPFDLFEDPFAWLGGSIPGPGTHAYVRRGGTVQEVTADEVKFLTIGDKDTEPNHFGTTVLEVLGDVTATSAMRVNALGELDLEGGNVESPRITVLGDVVGDGNITAKHFDSSRKVEATGGDGDPLRFFIEEGEGFDNKYLDWDGGDDPKALVQALKGDIEVEWTGEPTVLCYDFAFGDGLPTQFDDCNSEELIDAFDGTMEIGVGRRVLLSRPWAIGDKGQLTLEGGQLEPAKLQIDGSDSRLWFWGQVAAKNWAIIDADTHFVDTDNDLGDGDHDLWLDGDTTLQNATFKGGGGKLRMRGDLRVRDYAKVAFGPQAVFGWDEYVNSKTTVEEKAVFDIFATNISTSPMKTEFRATAIVHGTLNVVLFDQSWKEKATWGLSGLIDLVPGDALLAGSNLEILAGGMLHGLGRVVLEAEDPYVPDLRNIAGTIDVDGWDGEGKLEVKETFAQDTNGTVRTHIYKDGTSTYFKTNVSYVAGTLEIVADEGWEPKEGDTFFVFKSGELFGAFDKIIPPPIAEPLDWQVWYVTQPTHGVAISVISKK